MAIKLVNTDPGNGTDALKPGQAVHLGLRSDTLSIIPGTFSASIGLSNITNHGDIPTSDTALSSMGVSASLETPERVRPINTSVGAAISSGKLVLTKSSNLDSDLSIYEIAYTARPNQSALAYFNIKFDSTWTKATRDWSNLSNVAPVYLGLEIGHLNTGCFLFFRDNGAGGTLVSGGPVSSIGGVRPGQTEYNANWTGLPNGSNFELWIYYNAAQGRFELWGKSIFDTTPNVLATIAIGSLGTFSSTYSNFRSGPSNVNRLFFGNAGDNGDIVQFNDWTVIPDFRLAVSQGQAVGDHTLSLSPDSSTGFNAADKQLPKEKIPGRWFDYGSLIPSSSFYYQPGQKQKPTFIKIQKPDSTFKTCGYKKDEPRLEQRAEGFSVEAFLSGEKILTEGHTLSTGFLVDDGQKTFRVVMLDNGVTRTYGICKDDLQYLDMVNGYYTGPGEQDYTSLKLVRLTVDRLRDKLDLYVDDSRVVSQTLSSATLPTSDNSKGVVAFGHIQQARAQNVLQLASLNYVNRYWAWEGLTDTRLPNSLSQPSASRFNLTAFSTGGSTISSNQPLVLDKTAINTGGSGRYYTCSTGQISSNSIQVDFRARVSTFTDNLGQQAPANTAVGAGVNIYTAARMLSFGFFDCGIHGRKIGIIPGSGSAADILNQTDVGKMFSASVDWTQMQSYRITYKPYDSIKVWVGSVAVEPCITIPWNDDFNLPSSLTTGALHFGHFDELTSSITEWEYVRWGLSNGLDAAIQQSYPDGYDDYLFGGKVVVLSDFNEA